MTALKESISLFFEMSGNLHFIYPGTDQANWSKNRISAWCLQDQRHTLTVQLLISIQVTHVLLDIVFEHRIVFSGYLFSVFLQAGQQLVTCIYISTAEGTFSAGFSGVGVEYLAVLALLGLCAETGCGVGSNEI